MTRAEYKKSPQYRENLKKAWAASAKAHTTHGMTYTPEYKAWEGMIQRCTNPNNNRWADWGGRGISVCDRWLNSFEAFYADMGTKPKGMQIDRINNNGNYEPGNCRWATYVEQCRNKRSNVMVTYCNITLCLTEWAAMTGFESKTLMRRHKLGKRGKDLFAPLVPRGRTLTLHRERGL